LVTKEEIGAREHNHNAAKEAAQQENIKKGGLTEENVGLRNNSNNLRKDFGTKGGELSRDQDENHGFIEKHNDIVNAYNATIDKYYDLLSQVEKTRVELETEANSVQTGISKENYSSVSLGRANDHTLSSTGILSDTSKQLSIQLDNLQSKYNSFIDSLNKITNDQDKEADELENKVKGISHEVNNLTHVLKEQTVAIEELHGDVDKENATNLNARLRHLIDTLVNVDVKRKAAQQNLEDGQTKWSIKLRLFLDEASRRSRETAREKRVHEIEKTINKIDNISRDIYRLQTELERAEIKLFTDANRELDEKELKNELDGIRLKLRWAEDERRLTFGELETLLSILRETNITEMQITEIDELRRQIEEYRKYLSEFRREIEELEREISLADMKIEELIELINQLNAEIEELNRILKERMQRIKQLESALGQSSKSKFSAVKGDSVDEMLAQYLSIAN
jgi:chromosome segregation ATPase